jgi:hypothetical protein
MWGSSGRESRERERGRRSDVEEVRPIFPTFLVIAETQQTRTGVVEIERHCRKISRKDAAAYSRAQCERVALQSSVVYSTHLVQRVTEGSYHDPKYFYPVLVVL